jgi:hypothetical protein
MGTGKLTRAAIRMEIVNMVKIPSHKVHREDVALWCERKALANIGVTRDESTVYVDLKEEWVFMEGVLQEASRRR